MRNKYSLSILATLLGGALQLSQAQLTINTATADDWKISNGAISLDWSSTGGGISSLYLAAYPSTNLVSGGINMDNTATGFTGITAAPSGVTPTASYHLDQGRYLDWWITWPEGGTNPFTITEHFILAPNDATVWTYYVTSRTATAPAGGFGQIQYLFRASSAFTTYYLVNSGLNNLGATEITQPTTTAAENAETGRNVQNAVQDLHGVSLPAGFGREFETKYDYSSYEYLAQVNGEYGSQFGAWVVMPTMESYPGGPTKQNLTYTGGILMGEILSGHLANDIGWGPPPGVSATRIWGPIGFHVNAFGGNITTPANMYADAQTEVANGLNLFALDTVLQGYGYVPNGAGRGTVSPAISGGGSSSANTAWAVLSDPNTDMQYSSLGNQYWTALNASGNGTIDNVTPGNYRLSGYVLGEWGQLRKDGIAVTAGQTTTPSVTFTPENFSPSGAAPIWTIGTPDRSAHEFLHGTNNYGDTGSCAGCDDREYQGTWNYWADFEATKGAVDYYATAVGATPATNDLTKWNYIQWSEFDPYLYDASNDTTDNYNNTIPAYVSSLPGATGTNGVTTTVPPWQVHFATTAAQVAQGGFVDLSVGLASAEQNLTVSLNGHPLTWNVINISDAMERSGFSGYYQWVVFEWPTSYLVANGGDNVLTFTLTQQPGNTPTSAPLQQGIEYDALRLEISNTGANPATTNWHDYEYVASNNYIPANVAVSNNNTGTASCTPTAITPYIYVNGAWVLESSVSATSTSTVLDLGPWPYTGGTWSWTGPNGFTSTARQLNTIPLTVGTDSFVATYSNTSGCKFQQNFTVTVDPIVPYLQVNGGAWQQTNTATVAAGSTVNLGPWPLTGGTWSWTGPNSFTSTSRAINAIALSTGVNTYVATYTLGTGSITQTFTITVE
jgi:hypothetical protein